jgi:hypothetical protein
VSKSLSPEFSIANSDICVVSHDAGGGELLASWVARQKQSCRLLLAGPALRVFERRLGHPLETVSLQQALQECDRFLTGTSWQSDFEWKLIRAARALGKPVVSFLDHWGHYRERFVRDGEECLPNAIWTGDEDFFFGPEDIELSWRLKKHGNLLVNQDAIAYHKIARSSAVSGTRIRTLNECFGFLMLIKKIGTLSDKLVGYTFFILKSFYLIIRSYNKERQLITLGYLQGIYYFFFLKKIK